MADPRVTLLDLLAKCDQGADPTFLRDGLKLLAQELMDAEVVWRSVGLFRDRAGQRGR